MRTRLGVFARRRTRRRRITTSLHLRITSLSTEVAGGRSLLLIIIVAALLRLLTVGWSPIVVVLRRLITILRLLGIVVVGIVLRLSCSWLASCPSCHVEWFATGLSSTTSAYTPGDMLAIVASQTTDNLRDEEEENECGNNNDGKNNPTRPTAPSRVAGISVTIAVAVSGLSSLQHVCGCVHIDGL